MSEGEARPSRWWRAMKGDRMMAETSSPGDFAHLGLLGDPEVTIEHLYEYPPVTEWRVEAPPEPRHERLSIDGRRRR
jgi:hypothetical protein